MINFKVIFRILGHLLVLEGVFLFLSFLVALLYQEADIQAFAISTGITFAVGISIAFFTRKFSKDFGKREGYIIVSLAWVVFSLFGTLPFLLSGAIPSFTDAFFETMSGFTTTGASILNNIEELPHGILFWRSVSQWIGGMGMIVMSLAILPMLGIGGMQLYAAEVPGPTPDKLHPRVRETAKRLWGIYILLTAVEVILLWIGEMNLFDAVCHSFTSMATGGYSTKQASIMFFQSPYTQYVITFFMFLAGVNFTLHYYVLKGRPISVWKNEEFRYYLGLVLTFTLLISTALAFQQDIWGGGFQKLEQAFRDSLFQVVSIVTTTGYVSADYLLWSPIALVLIFSLMFVGGSAGSTGGGMKVVRILLLFKNGALEFKRLMHPNAIIPVRLNHRAISPAIITNVLAFIVFYILIFVLGTIVMALLGFDLDSAMGSVIATLGNIGPGIGSVGPVENFANVPAFGKWFLSFLMLIGRLELFTVLILFSSAFWKK